MLEPKRRLSDVGPSVADNGTGEKQQGERGLGAGGEDKVEEYDQQHMGSAEEGQQEATKGAGGLLNQLADSGSRGTAGRREQR